MSEYVKQRTSSTHPRLPLTGNLDMTYRCNNDCRHCWVRLDPAAPEIELELSLDEIIKLVDEARGMGCRSWSFSGGEPMLREDFADIFDYATSQCLSYTLNTNGTLITPRIARLLKRKGNKMVALYGATADVHDHITRTEGSFDAVMEGIAKLKETGAGFTVQIVPMRDNYHQFQAMLDLAQSMSPDYRIGAAWLNLSASGDPLKNMEIREQRLSPRTVVELDTPDPGIEEALTAQVAHLYKHDPDDDRLFAACLSGRRDFHVDPYGGMSFCSYIKDPQLRYDLRQGPFQEAWDVFIPSLADKVKGGDEYLKGCAQCPDQDDCRWCPVYGFLEHGRFSAKIEYLCETARENRMYKEEWKNVHRRHFRIADMTIRVETDLPIDENTFHPKFRHFEVSEPGNDLITIRHHFALPDLKLAKLGAKVYENPPWTIYQKGNSLYYLGISPGSGASNLHRVVVCNREHTKAVVYNPDDTAFKRGNLVSLSMFPTDQILLARILADRDGLFLHSSGVVMDGMGLLFVGHSEAGKSTMVKMLRERAEILCDDRIILRRHPDGFRIHGTWSHGEVPDVSQASAPLVGVFFLEKAKENKFVPVRDYRERIQRILACLIKPYVTADWWDKTLTVINKLVLEVPLAYLFFDKSGDVVDLLKRFLETPAAGE
jgi:MoaA/NifB/PqqE/SkfB family radical SAM enzyme